MRTQLNVLVIALATLPISAQSKKEAWALSLEERIALRTDPELARERVRRNRGSQAASANFSSVADSFNGQTHPELFLPHQVFDELVGLAFLSNPRTSEVVRDGFMPEVRRHGLPADFWPRLQSVSSVYLADYRAVQDLLASLRKVQGEAADRANHALALKYQDACRSRADALTDARRIFGRQRFDRFLYEVMAVKMFSVADRLPVPDTLRRAEEGCR